MKRRSVLPGRGSKLFTDCGVEINCPATSQDKKQHFSQLPKESVFKQSPCQDTKAFSGTPRSVGVTTGNHSSFPPKRHRSPNPSSSHNGRCGKEKRETCTSESTIKTTKNHKLSSSLRGRSQTQSGEVCRVLSQLHPTLCPKHSNFSVAKTRNFRTG